MKDMPPTFRTVARRFLVSPLIYILLTSTTAASLCTQCQTSDINALKRYYNNLKANTVTFRQFVANLLTTLSTMTELSHIRQDLLELTRRYDDCMRTCEIPFTKRDQREGFVVYFWRRLYTRHNTGRKLRLQVNRKSGVLSKTGSSQD